MIIDSNKAKTIIEKVVEEARVKGKRSVDIKKTKPIIKKNISCPLVYRSVIKELDEGFYLSKKVWGIRKMKAILFFSLVFWYKSKKLHPFVFVEQIGDTTYYQRFDMDTQVPVKIIQNEIAPHTSYKDFVEKMTSPPYLLQIKTRFKAKKGEKDSLLVKIPKIYGNKKRKSSWVEFHAKISSKTNEHAPTI